MTETIETARLLLRLPDESDVPLVAEIFADPVVMRYIGRGETGTVDDAVERVAAMQRAWDSDGFGKLVVTLKDSGDRLGLVGPLAWDPQTWRPGLRSEIGEHAEVELGWSLARRAWGLGYATEAAAAVRDWTFDELRPRRLISLIHPDNTRSTAVAARIGEHFEHPITTHRGITAQLWTF